jgi:hypothetical protein
LTQRVLVAGALTLAWPLVLTSAAGATPSHPGGVPETCPEVLAGGPTGGLEKSTNPPPGTDVSPGSVIEVTLRWDPALFTGTQVHKVLDCVTVNGHAADDLSVQERDAADDGDFTTRMTVPGDVGDGASLCDRGFVSGLTGNGAFLREKSNDVCFTIRVGATPVALPAPIQSPAPLVVPGPAAIPESPTTAPSPPVEQVSVPAPPNENELGAGPAAHGPLGTEVSGAEEARNREGGELPRTGADLVWAVRVAVLALCCGQLARGAARRRTT